MQARRERRSCADRARAWPLAAALLLLGAGSARAQTWGAPAARIWSAPGDSAGAAPARLTLGAAWLERKGAGGQLADDEGLTDDGRPWAIFDWRGSTDGGRTVVVQGRLAGEDRVPGLFVAETGRPGEFRLRLFYRRLQSYDDPSADDPWLPAAVARDLPQVPLLRRAAAGFDYARSLGGGWRLLAGYEHVGAIGERAANARGLAAEPWLFGAPNALARDLLTHRAWLGGRYDGARAAYDWNLEFQSDGGDRSQRALWSGDGLALVESRTWDEERRAWSARAGGCWELGPRWTLLAGYGGLARTSRPEETAVAGVPGDVGSPAVADGTEVDLRAHTATATVLYRPRPWTRVRLAGRVQRLDQEGVSVLPDPAAGAEATRSSLDKERVRQVWSLDLQHAGLRRALVSAGYRFERADEMSNVVSLDEYAGGNVLVRAQGSERDRTAHDLHLRLRHRLSPRVTWTERIAWRTERTDQRDPTLVGQYAQGDRRVSRLTTELGLRAAPLAALAVDAGFQGLHETFEREDGPAVETRWDALRLFANASWWARPAVTLFAAFSFGREEYGVEGELPPPAADPAAFSPAEYAADTYRLAPGAIVRLPGRVELEGHYERVRNRDSVANDHDRWYARATAPLAARWSASATWRRYDFTAGYADDYEASLYGLAVTARF